MGSGDSSASWKASAGHGVDDHDDDDDDDVPRGRSPHQGCFPAAMATTMMPASSAPSSTAGAGGGTAATTTTASTLTTTTTTTTTNEAATGETPLVVSFNQDAGCFAVGTDHGFRIFNVDPFQEMFRRDFSSGGVRIVEMLFRSNILAIVGGGLNPRHPSHKVIIWDDHQSRSIGEMSFKSDVLAVRLRRDRIFVAIALTVYVYNFRDLKLVDRIDTAPNPLGLVAVSTSASRSVLACPGREKGTVHVEHYDAPSSKTQQWRAHETELVAIALNPEGSLVATASEKGTLVRVFDTHTKSLVHELRRGAERALIYSVAFHPASTHLACSSDKGTIHVFSLLNQAHPSPSGGGGVSGGSGGAPAGAAAFGSGGFHAQGGAATVGGAGAGGAALGAGESLVSSASGMVSTLAEQGFGSLFKGLLPKYFQSEWSYAQFRVPELKTLVAFGAEPNTIVVVGMDGVFYKASYDKPGEMSKKFFSRFMRGAGDAVMSSSSPE